MGPMDNKYSHSSSEEYWHSLDKSLSDALESEDFNKISNDLEKAITVGIQSAGKGLSLGVSALNNALVQLGLNTPARPADDPKLVEKNPSFKKKLVGYRFGQTLPVVMSPLVLIGLLLSVFGASTGAGIISLLFGAFLVGSFAFARHQIKQLNDKNNRFKRYLAELGSSTVVTVRDLALAVASDDETVVKDLKDMISKNDFKQARLVEQDSIFILDNKTYQEYKAFKKERSLEEQSQSPKAHLSLSTDEEESLATIKFHANKLFTLSKEVRGDAANKVAKLGELSRDIYLQATDKPEGISLLDRYTEYYLPLSVELVKRYIQYSNQSEQNSKVRDSLENIDHSLSALDQAFTELLEKLNALSLADLNSDITVLKTMLKQEGLLGKDFIV